MDYIVNYNVSNVNIHCVIQEKDAIIGRQQKEIEDLHKANQLLAKENNKLKGDLDLQKKLNEALEKFKYSLERHVAVLKDYDKNRWSVSETESEVTVWEHEYLIWKKTLEKKERDETQALLIANQSINQINSNTDVTQMNEQNRAQPHRRSAPKAKTIVVTSDGTVVKRYVCDYPNCTYSSNWAHDLKGHKRKHTGEKPYCCGWLNCNKSFRDLRDLKRHQRAHTGDKRYSCDWPGCDYRSTDVANLAKHKRTHTGEKPYKCTWSGCEASFADGSHLRRHQKKHENQFTKMMAKSAAPKKRQTVPKSLTIVKTRQQPGRRAKGSLRIPVDVSKKDGIDDHIEDKPNDSNRTNEVIDFNHKNSESIEESVNAKDLNHKNVEQTVKTNLDSDPIPDSTIDGIDSRLEPNEQMDGNNSGLIQQTNRTDVNQNSTVESNSTELGSAQTEEQNQNSMISDNNRLVVYKNPIVISSMIGEQNRSLNSSPLQENGTKYSDLQRI